MDIKVSVIVPVYNVENYLKQAISSVINQTLKEIEKRLYKKIELMI